MPKKQSRDALAAELDADTKCRLMAKFEQAEQELLELDQAIVQAENRLRF
jgi:hypothetical protein